MDFGHGATDVGRQTEMEILGEGLICSMHEGDYVNKFEFDNFCFLLS